MIKEVQESSWYWFIVDFNGTTEQFLKAIREWARRRRYAVQSYAHSNEQALAFGTYLPKEAYASMPHAFEYDSGHDPLPKWGVVNYVEWFEQDTRIYVGALPERRAELLPYWEALRDDWLQKGLLGVKRV